MSDVAMRPSTEAVGLRSGVWMLVRLKWDLLRGSFRRSSSDAFGLSLGLVLTVVAGGALAVGTVAFGRYSPEAAGPRLVVAMGLAPLVAVAFGAVLGTEGSIDPRRLAPLPIPHLALGLGSLTAAAVGIAGLGFALLAGGVILGFAPFGPGALIVVVAVFAELASVLVAARITANLLGIMASGRLERVANLFVAITGLTTAALAQGIAATVSQPTAWWSDVGRSLRWLPSIRLGMAATDAGTHPGSALLDLAFGLAALALAVWVHERTFVRFLVILPGGSSGAPRPRRRAARRWDGTASVVRRRFVSDPVWTVTVRSWNAKLRNPRQITNLIAAVVLGLGGIVGIIILGRNDLTPVAVLLGGAVQFLVLFDNQNCFGMDGRALGIDLLAADPRTIMRGKRLSAGLTGVIPALIIPLILAADTGGWRFVPVAWLLGLGSIIVASGVAVLVSTVAPVALPESANPFASVDAGRGCLASIAFVIGLTTLSLVSAPISWLMVEYSESMSAVWVLALCAVALSSAIGAVCERAAVSVFTPRTPELWSYVSPRD